MLALGSIGFSLGAARVARVAGSRFGADAVALWVALPVSAAVIGFTSANFLPLRVQASATQLFFGYGLLRKRTPFHDIESVAEVREEGKRREHFLSSHRPERLATAIANQLSRQPAIPLEDIAASRLAFGGTAPTCRGPGPARGHDI